ncbi:MAG: hypothetical protein FWE47_01175 [Oscillospiraceae bacterium]|nr:hypothetical protein [Oscillospiraceae bacterium]
MAFLSVGLSAQDFNPMQKEYTMEQAKRDIEYYKGERYTDYHKIEQARRNDFELQLSPKEQELSDNFKKMFIHEWERSERIQNETGIGMDEVRQKMEKVQVVMAPVTEGNENIGGDYQGNIIYIRYYEPNLMGEISGKELKKWSKEDAVEWNQATVNDLDKKELQRLCESYKATMRHEGVHHLLLSGGRGEVFDREGEARYLENILSLENDGEKYNSGFNYNIRADIVEGVIANVGARNYFDCGKEDSPGSNFAMLWNTNKASDYVNLDLLRKYKEMAELADFGGNPFQKGMMFNFSEDDTQFVTILKSIADSDDSDYKMNKLSAEFLAENADMNFNFVLGMGKFKVADVLGIEVGQAEELNILCNKALHNNYKLEDDELIRLQTECGSQLIDFLEKDREKPLDNYQRGQYSKLFRLIKDNVPQEMDEKVALLLIDHSVRETRESVMDNPTKTDVRGALKNIRKVRRENSKKSGIIKGNISLEM